MALRPCKECKKEISTDAKVCPHCGKKQKSMGCAGIGCASVVVLILLLWGIGHMLETKNTPGLVTKQQPQNNPQPPKPQQTPEQILSEAQKHIAAGDVGQVVGLVQPLVHDPTYGKQAQGVLDRLKASRPPYRIFRQSTESGLVSVVVDRATKDEQIKTLLWYFREKVRGRRLHELGLSTAFERSGVIIVYRGDRCANEEFINTLGPCGYGDHNDASYQWGLNGDPDQDTGDLGLPGQQVSVFNSSDHWYPSQEDQRKLEVSQKEREDYAVRLSLSFRNEGLDISPTVDRTTLELDSKDFEQGTVRREFIRQMLSEKRMTKELCGLGFRDIFVGHLEGILAGEVGDRVSLGCR